MKAVVIVLIAVLGAAWAKLPSQSVPVGTVRTEEGEVEVVKVFSNGNQGLDGPKPNFSEMFEQMTKSPRIINGEIVKHIQDFPMVVSMWVFDPASGNGGIFCTGTIVDKDILLTAAHCMDIMDNPIYQTPTTRFFVCGGTKNIVHERKFLNCADMSDVYIRGDWDPDAAGPSNDIALVTLKDSIIAPRIKRTKFAFEKPAHKAPIFMVGWGVTDPEGTPDGYMRFTPGEVRLNDGRCERLNFVGLDNNLDLICAIGDNLSGTCYGDSGGPLLVNRFDKTTGKGKNHRQVGILSFGETQCGPQWEGAYTALYDGLNERFFKYVVSEVIGGTYKSARLRPRNRA